MSDDQTTAACNTRLQEQIKGLTKWKQESEGILLGAGMAVGKAHLRISQLEAQLERARMPEKVAERVRIYAHRNFDHVLTDWLDQQEKPE